MKLLQEKRVKLGFLLKNHNRSEGWIYEKCSPISDYASEPASNRTVAQ